MPLKPGDAYVGLFTTARFDTGAATDADSLPAATATHNGTDDAAFVLTCAKLATGRYKVTGTIPTGYANGDSVWISVAATVNSVAGAGVVDGFVLDTGHADINSKSFNKIISYIAAATYGNRTEPADRSTTTISGVNGGGTALTSVNANNGTTATRTVTEH